MRRLALASLLLLPLVSCAEPAPLEVEDVWVRATVGGAVNAAVFMTIRSPAPDRLVAASAPVARKTDLMTMTGGSGAMEMKYVRGIDIPAGRPVSLDPSGLHIWLAGLKRPLKAGESFPLSLQFEKAGERRVTVSVLEPAAAPPTSGMPM